MPEAKVTPIPAQSETPETPTPIEIEVLLQDTQEEEDFLQDMVSSEPFRSRLVRQHDHVKFEELLPSNKNGTVTYPPVSTEVLTAMVDYVEAYLHKNRRPPNVTELQVYCKLQMEHLYRLLEDPHSPLSVRLERRGLPTPLSPEVPGVNTELSYENWLTPQQVAAIRCIVDFRDIRPVEKKLESLGVSTLKYSGWLSDPQFKAYLMSKAEDSIQGFVPEMHGKVVSLAQGGDMKAIKLFYELAGRVDRRPTNTTQVNVNNYNQNETFTLLVEAVQRHVRDPEVLAAIAQEFDQLTSNVSGGTAARTSTSHPQLTARRE